MSRLGAIGDSPMLKEDLSRQIKSLQSKLGRVNKGDDNKFVIAEVLKLSKKMTEFQAAQSKQIAQHVASQLTPVRPPKRSPTHAFSERSPRGAKESISSVFVEQNVDALSGVSSSSPLHSFIDRHKEMVEKNAAFVMNGLQAKLMETQDEYMRQASMLENESKERRKQEQRNIELGSKLAEARQGLRETQQALQNVQHAMEQALIKRDQKDMHMQKLQTENNQLLDRIQDMEIRLRDQDSTSKSVATAREALLEQLKDQLGISQESLHKLQVECLRLRGEKTLLEADVDSNRRKCLAIEARFKHLESEAKSEYQVEIDRQNEKIKTLTEKLETSRATESLVAELYQEIKDKSNLMKVMESRALDHEQLRRDLEMKLNATEGHLRSSENNIKQLEYQLRQHEQDLSTAQGEIQSLKRSVQHSEDMLKEVAYQLQSATAEKEMLKENIMGYETKQLRMNELQESLKKLKREHDRAQEEIDEQTRRIAEHERTIRIYNDERISAESQMKTAQNRLAHAVNSEHEARTMLNEANTRIAELFSTASEMSARLAVEQQKNERLERELALNHLNSFGRGDNYYAKPSPPNHQGYVTGHDGQSPRAVRHISQPTAEVVDGGEYPNGGQIGQYDGPSGGRVYPSRGQPPGRGRGRGGPPPGPGVPGQGRNGPGGPMIPGRGNRQTFVQRDPPPGVNRNYADYYSGTVPSEREVHSVPPSTEAVTLPEQARRPLSDSAIVQSLPPEVPPSQVAAVVPALNSEPVHDVPSGTSTTGIAQQPRPGRQVMFPTHLVASVDELRAAGTLQQHEEELAAKAAKHASKHDRQEDPKKDVDGIQNNVPLVVPESSSTTGDVSSSAPTRSVRATFLQGGAHLDQVRAIAAAHAANSEGSGETNNLSTRSIGSNDGSESTKHHHRHHHSSKSDKDVGDREVEDKESKHHHRHHSSKSGKGDSGEGDGEPGESSKHHHHHHHSSKSSKGDIDGQGELGESSKQHHSSKSVESETKGPETAIAAGGTETTKAARTTVVNPQDVQQLRSLFGRQASQGIVLKTGHEAIDNLNASLHLGLQVGDDAANKAKLERFVSTTQKVIDDMKEKRQKYSEELEKWTENFEKTNERKAVQSDLPKDLLTKVTKVSELLWGVQTKVNNAKKFLDTL